MSNMISLCVSLNSLDVSRFDTSHVVYMSCMFNDCRHLESLDLSGFDTSKVTDMSYMFSICIYLSSLDLSNFDTSKVINMYGMLFALGNSKSLNLSNFNSSEVMNMMYMFCDMRRKLFLDLTGFNLENVDESTFDKIFKYIDIKFLNIKDIKSKDSFINEINNLVNKSSMFLCLNDVNLIPKIDSDITIYCNFDVDTETCDSSNYISLYYSCAASYSSDFANNNRNYISFLKYNNQITKKYSSISIEPNEKLEVKFSFPIENIDNFSFNDENINSLVSIDFSNLIHLKYPL